MMKFHQPVHLILTMYGRTAKVLKITVGTIGVDWKDRHRKIDIVIALLRVKWKIIVGKHVTKVEVWRSLHFLKDVYYTFSIFLFGNNHTLLKHYILYLTYISKVNSILKEVPALKVFRTFSLVMNFHKHLIFDKIALLCCKIVFFSFRLQNVWIWRHYYRGTTLHPLFRKCDH